MRLRVPRFVRGLSANSLALALAIVRRGATQADSDRLRLLFGVRAIGRALGLSRHQV